MTDTHYYNYKYKYTMLFPAQRVLLLFCALDLDDMTRRRALGSISRLVVLLTDSFVNSFYSPHFSSRPFGADGPSSDARACYAFVEHCRA